VQPEVFYRIIYLSYISLAFSTRIRSKNLMTDTYLFLCRRNSFLNFSLAPGIIPLNYLPQSNNEK